MPIADRAAYVPLDNDTNILEHPPELDRNLLESIFNRSGATRLGEWVLSPGAGTREWQISAGGLFVLGTETTDQGGYYVWGTGSPMESGNLAAAVGNPYIASVILHIPDAQYGTVGAPEPYIQVYSGTPAASPTALPDSTWNFGGASYLPGAWFRVGDVRVNTADSGAIPAGQFTSHGKYVKNAVATFVGVSTDTFSDARAGDFRFDQDTGYTRQYTGTTWRAVRSGENIDRALFTNLTSNLTAGKSAATNLAFYGEANVDYHAEYKLRYWGGTGEDASMDWTMPAGASIVTDSLSMRSLLGSATSISDALYSGVASSPSGLILGIGVNSTRHYADVNVIFRIGPTPGLVTPMWGQNSAGPSAAVLGQASTVHVRRLG